MKTVLTNSDIGNNVHKLTEQILQTLTIQLLLEKQHL